MAPSSEEFRPAFLPGWPVVAFSCGENKWFYYIFSYYSHFDILLHILTSLLLLFAISFDAGASKWSGKDTSLARAILLLYPFPEFFPFSLPLLRRRAEREWWTVTSPPNTDICQCAKVPSFSHSRTYVVLFTLGMFRPLKMPIFFKGVPDRLTNHFMIAMERKYATSRYATGYRANIHTQKTWKYVSSRSSNRSS